MYSKYLKLVKKYKLQANSYYTESPYENIRSSHSPLEIVLLEKWGWRTSKGYYGISLGQPTPDVFLKAIDDFLTLVESYNPNFEIQQIKIKFGQVRIYLAKISDETQKCIDELEKLLYDKFLIY